jgi:uncharacterized protein (TIGR00730 family)
MTRSFKIVVFCGSKLSTENSYADEMRKIAENLKKNAYELIFGASSMGLMNVLCEACHAINVPITGVINKRLFDKNIAYPFCDKLIVEENVHLRKFKMGELADAVICFPGGVGTVDEFFSILASNSLRETQLPIVLLNLKGYYDLLIELLEKMCAFGFMKKDQLEEIIVCDSVEQAFLHLKARLASES